MKQLKLFLITFFVTGFSIVFFAFLGGLIGKKIGFYTGAPIGGYIGIHLSAKLAQKRQWIAKNQLWPVIIGAVLVFGTTEAFQNWVVSSATHSFGAMAAVALGAVVGSQVKRNRGSGQTG
jgi:hypothetical protein